MYELDEDEFVVTKKFSGSIRKTHQNCSDNVTKSRFVLLNGYPGS